VPSWIMKYYILDLSPHNSMVGFLLEQGHTVFMISWKNPVKEDRDLGMHDYLESGLLTAMEQVALVTDSNPVHAVGYCLGGTLLTIAAAAIEKDAKLQVQYNLPPIKSISLLASLTDFEEPGELGLFIDESQLAMIDAVMWEQGFLTGEQMSGSFQLLNSRDLIWSKMMREYQLGKHGTATDLTSWNADTTRMPYRMHSEYMKHLFLHNDLAEGRYEVDGHAIALNDIHPPMFVVATERDHISPWCSVYQIHLLTNAPITFILVSSGHNGGIIAEPGHHNRSYRHLAADQRGKAYSDPKEWLQLASTEEGSWWPHWHDWLARLSSKKKIIALQPQDDAQLGDAPGRYVLEK
jgi:polyhydroxyalkanoate synthase